MAKYKCRYGCGFETGDRWAIGGHTASCELNPRKRGQKKVEGKLTVFQVADALLNKVVTILTDHEGLVAKCDELNAKCEELSTTKGTMEWEVEQLKIKLKEVTDEKDRILKIHNEQVSGRKGLSDTETLLRLAKET